MKTTKPRYDPDRVALRMLDRYPMDAHIRAHKIAASYAYMGNDKLFGYWTRVEQRISGLSVFRQLAERMRGNEGE